LLPALVEVVPWELVGVFVEEAADDEDRRARSPITLPPSKLADLPLEETTWDKVANC
jgi:hypothetical protein